MTGVADRVRHHRLNLRVVGLRPLQIWVPDTKREGFADECRRQSKQLQDDPHEPETLDWLRTVADTAGWK